MKLNIQTQIVNYNKQIKTFILLIETEPNPKHNFQSNEPQSSDQAKGLLKNMTLQPSKQSEIETPHFNELGKMNNAGSHETCKNRKCDYRHKQE